jgi:hypothetical protein
LQAPYVGYPAARNIDNRDKLERQLIIAVTSPFDVAGTTVMLWRYLGDRQDTNFSYVPAIRRLRRVSAANRSDPFVGSDGATDDFMGYDGKIPVFQWKLLKKQVGLLPFPSTKPETLVKTEKGEYRTTKQVTPVKYGFQTEGWQGAPWCAVSFVWVKRPVFVIEMEPEDRYYNYGTQYLWVDAETFWPIWKVIQDRSGRYWKTMFISQAGFQTADEKMRAMLCSSMQCIDDKTDHATYVEIFSQRNESRIFADVDYDDFSLAGIAKYCK